MAETKIEDVDSAKGVAHDVAATGRKVLEEGYENLREYGEKSLGYAKGMSGDLVEFVKREPLIAVGAAFLAGYVVAQIFRRLPS